MRTEELNRSLRWSCIDPAFWALVVFLISVVNGAGLYVALLFSGAASGISVANHLFGRKTAAKKVRPLALGAQSEPCPPQNTSLFGVIEESKQLNAPCSGKPCVGYSLELANNGDVMLRDSGSLGFNVRLDSGERVSIPQKGVLIFGTLEVAERKESQLNAYLATIDPNFTDSKDLPLFAVDSLKIAVLQVGDRVEIAAKLLPKADSIHQNSAYREAYASELYCEGIAKVALVELAGHIPQAVTQ